MIVSRMQVRWLTCVTVRPAWRRASARVSPMLTPRLRSMSNCAPPGGAVTANEIFFASLSEGPVTKCRHPPAKPARTSRVCRHSKYPRPYPYYDSRTVRSGSPAAGGNCGLILGTALERRHQRRQVVGLDQHISGLGALAGTDDAAAFQQVHEPARLGEADPQLALQHRGGSELRADDQLGRGQHQFEVVADVLVDLPLLALG